MEIESTTQSEKDNVTGNNHSISYAHAAQNLSARGGSRTLNEGGPSASSIRAIPEGVPKITGQIWGPRANSSNLEPSTRQGRTFLNNFSQINNNGNNGSNQQQTTNDDNDFILVQSRRWRRYNARLANDNTGLQGAPPPVCDIFISRVQCGDEQTINAFLARNHICVLENV